MLKIISLLILLTGCASTEVDQNIDGYVDAVPVPGVDYFEGLNDEKAE